MATILMIAGLGMSVMGQIQQGNIARQQAEAQAEINEYNAAQKEVEAAQNLEGAKIEELRTARLARLFKGEQVARMGMSGMGFTGSSIEVLGDIAYQTKMDRDLILRSGTIAGQQSRAEAKGDRFAAQWSRLYGKQAQSASMMGAMATGIKGAYSIWGTLPMGR
jgi:hypothetical protein